MSAAGPGDLRVLHVLQGARFCLGSRQSLGLLRRDVEQVRQSFRRLLQNPRDGLGVGAPSDAQRVGRSLNQQLVSGRRDPFHLVPGEPLRFPTGLHRDASVTHRDGELGGWVGPGQTTQSDTSGEEQTPSPNGWVVLEPACTQACSQEQRARAAQPKSAPGIKPGARLEQSLAAPQDGGIGLVFFWLVCRGNHEGAEPTRKRAAGGEWAAGASGFSADPCKVRKCLSGRAGNSRRF